MTTVGDSHHIFIDQLKSMSNLEFNNKFDETLFHILSSINLWDIPYICEAFDLFLRQCFATSPFEDLEDKLFKPTFTRMNDIIVKIYEELEDCDKQISYHPDKTNKKLIQCAGLIKCMSNILGYVNENETMDYKYIWSIPASTAFVLCFTYKHCKSSESIYGSNTNIVYDALANLFSTSQVLQNQLIKLISLRINYKFYVKEELQHFIEVFSLLVQCGENVIPLDVRSTASQWKTISELTEKYKEAFQEFIINEKKNVISKPICILCSEMNKSLFNITELRSSECAQAARFIKLNNFFMKILMKLCETYKGYIAESVSDILSLFYTIFGMSTPILTYRGSVSEEISSLIQTHVHVGAQILVGNLMKDEGFINKLLQEDPGENNLPYLLLCISIMKRLISSPKKVRNLWIPSKSINLIQSVFKVISKSYYEFSLGIKYPGVALEGQAPTECDLYELLLTNIGGFVLTADALEFDIIENILLHIITDIDQKTNKLWAVFMASDLICLIDRYGTAELCFHHVTFFSAILTKIPGSNLITHTDLSHLKNILCRTFCFLPKSYKNNFLQEYNIRNNPTIYIAIELRNVDSFDANELTQMVRDCETLISEFMKSGDPSKFNEMSDLLLLISTADIQECVAFTVLFDGIINLWKCTNQTSQLKNQLSKENNSKSSNKFLTKFIMFLTKVTSKFILNFNNSQLLIILIQMNNFIHDSNTSIKLKICSILKVLSVKNLENDGHTSMCLKRLSNLFKILLMDDNAIVEQMALEAFSSFSHCTTHEEVITNIMRADKNLQKKLKEFLLGKPFVKTDNMDLDSYLRKLAQNNMEDNDELISSGQTIEFDEDEISDIFQEFDEIPAKIPKLDSDDDIRNILVDIQCKTDLLVAKSNGESINDELREMLLTVTEKLHSLL